jgi:hypothetical protein
MHSGELFGWVALGADAGPLLGTGLGVTSLFGTCALSIKWDVLKTRVDAPLQGVASTL